MEWLLKSEIDGRGVTGEEYILELLPLPCSLERIATTYEKLIFLNHVDLIVLHSHVFKGCECPPLFCFCQSEINLFVENTNSSESFQKVSKILTDVTLPDGSTKWFKILNTRYSLNTFAEALLNVPADEGRSLLEETMKGRHLAIQIFQDAFAASFLFYCDKTEKQSYFGLLRPLKYIYYEFLKTVSDPYDAIYKLRKHNFVVPPFISDAKIKDFKKIPTLIEELERECAIIRIGDRFKPAISLRSLFKNLSTERKYLLRNICSEWIINGKTLGSYTKRTIDYYIQTDLK